MTPWKLCTYYRSNRIVFCNGTTQIEEEAANEEEGHHAPRSAIQLSVLQPREELRSENVRRAGFVYHLNNLQIIPFPVTKARIRLG